MPALSFGQEQLILRIGIALLHFLWQGTLIAIAAALLLAALRRSVASLRYLVAVCCLLLMVIAPIFSFFFLTKPGANSQSAAVAALLPRLNNSATPNTLHQLDVAGAQRSLPPPDVNPAHLSKDSFPLQDFFITARGWLWANASTFTFFWLIGVLAFSLRIFGGCIYLRRYIASAQPLDIPPSQHMLTRLASALSLRRTVCLLESSHITVPAVIGWLKPTVLLPTAVVCGLSPQHLEAVILHELAHIKRHDYIINSLQTIIETLLFYHPAVWWLSNRIRIEREHCCDDLVVSSLGDAKLYIRALAQLEHIKSQPPALALAATQGSLLLRARRLLLGSLPSHGRICLWPIGLVLIVIALCMFFLFQVIALLPLGDSRFSATPQQLPYRTDLLRTLSNASAIPTISADGRYIAFWSCSDALLPTDTNHQADIFVYDRFTERLELASVNSHNKQANAASGWDQLFDPINGFPCSISDDGRFVAFDSLASNLVDTDNNQKRDIFVRDRNKDRTYRVSVNSRSGESNGDSYAPRISGDGRFIAFISFATNLTEDKIDHQLNAFLHDRKTGNTILLRPAGNSPGHSGIASLSNDGRFVAFEWHPASPEYGSSGQCNIYLWEREKDNFICLDTDTSGQPAAGMSLLPSISADGNFITFSSNAPNLTTDNDQDNFDVFLFARGSHKLKRIMPFPANNGFFDASLPSISASGRFIVFMAGFYKADLEGQEPVGGIFLHDQQTGTTRLIDTGTAPSHYPYEQVDSGNCFPSISADGRYLVFEMGSYPALPDDLNWKRDIYLYDLPAKKITLASAVK